MKKISILWTDDEIDILRPHVIFLEQKGYDVTTATNGTDAIDLVQENHFDMIFLDENMPGLTGLQTLGAIKLIAPNVPVVMITKSEEEDIMDPAMVEVLKMQKEEANNNFGRYIRNNYLSWFRRVSRR